VTWIKITSGITRLAPSSIRRIIAAHAGLPQPTFGHADVVGGLGVLKWGGIFEAEGVVFTGGVGFVRHAFLVLFTVDHGSELCTFLGECHQYHCPS
jgi:hypothetical protein